MVNVNIIWLIFGFIITLISGGAMGAVLNRRYQINDRKKAEERAKDPFKIRLEKVEDKQEFIPIGDGKHFVKKAYKIFKLINVSGKNIEQCKLIFEFDKYSKIANHKIITPKGTYQCTLAEKEKVKYAFLIKEFNKTNSIEFRFEQNVENLREGNGFENFWDAFLVDCTGFELEKITLEENKLPSVSNELPNY